MRNFLTLSFIFIVICGFAQPTSSFLPQNVGVNINSEYDEFNPILSPDGKTLFFVRADHPENIYGYKDSQDIWYSTFDNGVWTPAKRLENLNVGRYNAVLGISSDGNTLLLNGIYNKSGTFWKKRGLSISKKTDNNWSVPEKLIIRKLSKKNRGFISSATISADGQTIIAGFSKQYNGNRCDLYTSSKKANGKWSRPKKIRDLKTNRNETAPFLTPDNKTIYFTSDSREKGQYDIYKAYRTSTDFLNWSDPVMLSDTINTDGWDSYLTTNKKGSWAWFASANPKSLGQADIFTVKLFEENPFVVVYGNVLNSRNKKPMIGKNFKININGQIVDSVKINYDSATYKVWLPLKNEYTLSALMNNSNPKNAIVDVKNIREFTKKEQDLLIEPFPYVRVNGKMLIEGTNESIPSYASPMLLVNGVTPDSLRLNPIDGSYSFLVSHGTTHQVQMKATKFDSAPTVLDLTSIEQYIDTLFNVYASREKMAMVYGRIINKKTNSIFPRGTKLAINVAGESTVYAVVDTTKSTYELRLPFGKAYDISASAPGYYPVYETINAQQRVEAPIYKDLIIAPIEVGQSIRLNNIFFASGKSILKPESFAELDRVTEFLMSNTIKIAIEGHTDNVGKAASNQKLSESRAKAVVTYIVAKGISKDRLVAKGYGSNKPVADNKSATGKAQNRRVEFTILEN